MIISGYANRTTTSYSTISGGGGGEASAPLASITGGRLGKAPLPRIHAPRWV
jgi:hypothetical protein